MRTARNDEMRNGGQSDVLGGDENRHPLLDQLNWLARLFDEAFIVPGTNYRIGLDALIGLVPGIGDLIGTALGFYIVWGAAQLGASIPTLVRMLGNVCLDTLVGAVPILGDLFDFGWKSNTRNLQLLRTHLQSTRAAMAIPAPAVKRRLGVAAMIILITFFAILVGLVVTLVRFLQWLF